MARNQSNTGLKIAGAATAAIVGGVAIGYLIAGTHTPQTVEAPTPQPAPIVSTPTPPVKLPVARPHTGNGDYSAPGAPRIAIREESTPIMRRVTQTPGVVTDAEASQEVAPPVKPTRMKPADDAAKLNADTGGDAGTPPAPADGNASATTPTPPVPDTPTPPAPADPDFEHVGKPADPESGQEGGGKAQFRVQTGSYNDESKARSDADELRSQGFNTSTRSEREGDHLVYKVQVGAYKSKGGADKAAEDLQKKGYPAYISPIGQ